MMWIKHKAYMKHDSQTYDKALSAEAEQAFQRYCAAAKLEQSRARRPVSTVTYGGI